MFMLIMHPSLYCFLQPHEANFIYFFRTSYLVNFIGVYHFTLRTGNVTKINCGLAISLCAPTNYQLKVLGRAIHVVVHSKYIYIIMSTLYLLQRKSSGLKLRRTKCKTMAPRLPISIEHFMRHVYMVVKGQSSSTATCVLELTACQDLPSAVRARVCGSVLNTTAGEPKWNL